MVARLQAIRLLADDLTGALDSAAAFAAPDRPVAVCWRGNIPAEGHLVIDSATREVSDAVAAERVARFAPLLWSEDGTIAFKKVDSLLRGPQTAELATAIAAVRPASCIIAPAFPAQGRITRDGRQSVRDGDGWRPVPCDLAGELESHGFAVARCRAGDPVPPGISFWDAASDADLDAIVAAAGDSAMPLWVGSAGLASALARSTGHGAGAAPPPLSGPLLGLVGSDHPASHAQLAAMAESHVRLVPGKLVPPEMGQRLATGKPTFVSVSIPMGTSRADAAEIIAAAFGPLVRTLDPPGTLFASGGETLRGVCMALETRQLDLLGDLVPGVPVSLMRGGLWDGIPVISKSGAFGASDLLHTLVAATAAAKSGAAS